MKYSAAALAAFEARLRRYAGKPFGEYVSATASSLSEKAAEAALQKPRSLDERYTIERGRILVSGTQALVRLPMIQRQRDLAAGLNTAGYVSGYRGSPLAGFDRDMQRAAPHLAANHIVFRPGLNEDLAATAVWGTQQTGMFPGARYDGVFSMWYGKGPGVDRSMDAIRHANAAGTGRHGGVLLLAGDDHGAVSSTLPHQSEHNLISAMVPLLSPAGVAEYIEFGLLGWAMSRFSGAWVGFKCQTEIVESSTTVDIDPTRPKIVLPEFGFPAEGFSIRWPDGARSMEGRLERKMDAVHAFARVNGIDRIVGDTRSARIGIVSTGKSWLDVKGALSALGLDEGRSAELGIRLYKIGLVWPLEPVGLRRFADGLDEILVVEEKRPIIEDQIKSLLFNLPEGRRPRVVGKRGVDGAPLLPSTGEINVVSVARAIASRLGDLPPSLAARMREIGATASAATEGPAGPAREPYFCSGCPHSISTVVPEGSRASTGIGCHMMVVGMERDTSTFTQMGGEGASWIGLSPFTDEKHIFVNMGDGTYFHSGLLAIRAAIAAGVNATYKILYNDAVAMTGGQPHDGELSVPSIIEQVLAEGARRVVVVSERPEALVGKLPNAVAIYHRDELAIVQRELRSIEGVTVLVFDQVCAAEKRRRRKRGTYPISQRRAFINDLVCEGCGDCSAVSNCISVEPKETEFGRKRAINQSSCNTDLSCIKGFCPSFVTVEGGSLRKPKARPNPAIFDELPPPPLQRLDRPYNMLLAGIGGTGVVTVSAILSQAAHFDGLSLVCLDQTGLAQKNGAVTSHIRLAPDARQLDAPRIGPGEADLVLGFDVVVSAAAASLATMAAGRTRLVLDDRFAPTASFVKNTMIDFHQEATLRRLRQQAGKKAVSLVAATKLGMALTGDAVAANMLLLGYAWQSGLVPITLASIDRAIELNGAGVATNRVAFGWGRHAAVDLVAVLKAAGQDKEEPPAQSRTIDEMVARRAVFLTDYQDARYAERYRSLVARARAAEAAIAPNSEGFAKAVASSAFRLMAYKDEYEVARLHRNPSFKKAVAGQFEGDFKLRYHLAPPILSRIDPRTGQPAKIAFGAWIVPVFAVLARLKGLRGTRFDPFGLTEERRQERRMIEDYFTIIVDLSVQLTPENLAIAIEIASLPEGVKGFGHIKRKSIGDFNRNNKKLLETFHRLQNR